MNDANTSAFLAYVTDQINSPMSALIAFANENPDELPLDYESLYIGSSETPWSRVRRRPFFPFFQWIDKADVNEFNERLSRNANFYKPAKKPKPRIFQTLKPLDEPTSDEDIEALIKETTRVSATLLETSIALLTKQFGSNYAKTNPSVLSNVLNTHRSVYLSLKTKG